MKIGYKALLVCLVTAALLVPAATAESGNGNGNGNGNGPPAWAGGGNGGSKAKGEAARAEAKAQRAARKQERRAARDVATESDEDGPKHENPAWICKFEREQMGAEAFADEYGTEANAFGKCVSQEAHDRDGVAGNEEAEAPESGDEEPPAPDDSGDEDSGGDGALAAVRAFLQSLVEMVF